MENETVSASCRKKVRSKRPRSRINQLKMAKDVQAAKIIGLEEIICPTCDVGIAKHDDPNGPNVLTSNATGKLAPTKNPPTPRKSRRKMKLTGLSKVDENERCNSIESFAVIDLELLTDAFLKSAVCKECKLGKLHLQEIEKQGTLQQLSLACSEAAAHLLSFSTSQENVKMIQQT